MLAMDTSTPAITVALHDGSEVVAEETVVDRRQHTEFLMPQVMRALSDAGVGRRDLTNIAVGVGPGPFTGLRVGLAAARVMGEALGLPVAGVCSLDVVAVDVVGVEGDFLVASDARRREVYWARYDASGRRLTNPSVDTPASLPGSLPAAGAGPRLYPDAFVRALDPEYPSAASLAAAVVAESVETLPPEPLYLRHADVTMPGKRKSVLT